MNDFKDQPKDVWPQPGDANFSAYVRGGVFGYEHAREEAINSMLASVMEENSVTLNNMDAHE